MKIAGLHGPARVGTAARDHRHPIRLVLGTVTAMLTEAEALALADDLADAVERVSGR